MLFIFAKYKKDLKIKIFKILHFDPQFLCDFETYLTFFLIILFICCFMVLLKIAKEDTKVEGGLFQKFFEVFMLIFGPPYCSLFLLLYVSWFLGYTPLYRKKKNFRGPLYRNKKKECLFLPPNLFLGILPALISGLLFQ